MLKTHVKLHLEDYRMGQILSPLQLTVSQADLSWHWTRFGTWPHFNVVRRHGAPSLTSLSVTSGRLCQLTLEDKAVYNTHNLKYLRYVQSFLWSKLCRIYPIPHYKGSLVTWERIVQTYIWLIRLGIGSSGEIMFLEWRVQISNFSSAWSRHNGILTKNHVYDQSDLHFSKINSHERHTRCFSNSKSVWIKLLLVYWNLYVQCIKINIIY